MTITNSVRVGSANLLLTNIYCHNYLIYCFLDKLSCMLSRMLLLMSHIDVVMSHAGYNTTHDVDSRYLDGDDSPNTSAFHFTSMNPYMEGHEGRTFALLTGIDRGLELLVEEIQLIQNDMMLT